MEPKTRTWIVFPNGTKFGKGRARLMRLVESEGSLNRAVKRMGMSYRSAWGYVQELEAAAGFPFLDPSAAGARLTPEGERFIAAFERYVARIDAEAQSAFEDEFGARSSVSS